jgi:archaellum component FlaF (FlaF/FlaG flagellin family)
VPSGTTYLGVSNLVSTGTNVSFALTNLGVQTITGSTYLGASSSTGTITLTNLGVRTLAGTANQILVNGGTAASTGTITLTLPQSIATTNSPTFAGLTITDLFAGGAGSTGTVHGTWNLASGATFLATYADLAERYAADDFYTPGTVLVIGGTQEVTVTTERASVARAGIVSTNPAFTLNAIAGDDTTHPYIALAGRVPCKVTGMIKKGDLLVTSTVVGHAESAQFGDDPNAAIGRALENFVGDSGVIEVMVI